MRGHVIDDLYQEVAMLADHVAFWKFQAIWHRAYMSVGKEPDSVDLKKAEIELERARQQENRERHAHAEPPRDIGS